MGVFSETWLGQFAGGILQAVKDLWRLFYEGWRLTILVVIAGKVLFEGVCWMVGNAVVLGARALQSFVNLVFALDAATAWAAIESHFIQPLRLINSFLPLEEIFAYMLLLWGLYLVSSQLRVIKSWILGLAS